MDRLALSPQDVDVVDKAYVSVGAARHSKVDCSESHR